MWRVGVPSATAEVRECFWLPCRLQCRGIAPLRQPAETCEKPRRQTSERRTFLATRVGAAIYLSKPKSRDETSNRWVSNDCVGVGRSDVSVAGLPLLPRDVPVAKAVRSWQRGPHRVVDFNDVAAFGVGGGP